MHIHYYKQEEDHTCGAASVRMALSAFGVRRTERILVKQLKTNKIVGTSHKNLIKVASKYKLETIAKKNGTLKELKQLLRQKYVIIICYFLENERCYHYAIVKKITNTNIYFLDPYNGNNHHYKLGYFKKIWHSHHWYERGDKKWFIALRKK
jgi:ABC-type bacteriocin/lantibiotic exporter with double-glycine peptidase domain